MCKEDSPSDIENDIQEAIAELKSKTAIWIDIHSVSWMLVDNRRKLMFQKKVLLAYFIERSKKQKATILWIQHSMLKCIPLSKGIMPCSIFIYEYLI